MQVNLELQQQIYNFNLFGVMLMLLCFLDLTFVITATTVAQSIVMDYLQPLQIGTVALGALTLLMLIN